MRTSYKNHWMLAAILFCGLVMTSCSDQQGIIDNPVTPEPEQASAKDPGKWWIDENNMDKSVKPGDNFFMYCIGSWWKNTTVDPKSHITTRLDFMKPNFDDKVRSLTDANYAIFKSHLKWADPNSETAASAQKLYDDVLKQSGQEEAKTSDDVMRAYGKMCAMGVGSCIKLQPFCHDNKICLYVANPEGFIEEVGGQANTTQSDKQPSINQIINENPDVMAHLVPICGKGGTRGIPEEWSFIKYILDGMGIDATQVFIYVLPDEMPGVKANGKATIAENIADLGDMEIAWQAFINRLEADGYTGNELKLMKQRFFLAYAEEYRSKYDANYVNRLAFGNDNPEAVNGHSMNKERVNGVVANMDGWYDAFDIEEGALYRKPAERIHI